MPNGLFITGADTEVGKTLVSCALARILRNRGHDVGVMKPVATGAVEVDGRRVSEDALLLREAAGVSDPLELINPILLGPPIAPVPAAEMDGIAPDVSLIGESFRRISDSHDITIVEGIGGILVPIVRGFTVADLAARLGLPVIIVSRPALGTVNHSLLTIEAARRRGIEPLGVVFCASRPYCAGPAERTCPREITEESGVKSLGHIPYLGALAASGLDSLAEACAERLDVDTILAALGAQ